MKKVKLTLDGINQFCSYLKECDIFVRLVWEYPSDIIKRIFMFHLQEIKNKLQVKTLQLMHKNKKAIIVKFTEAEQLCLSILFEQVQVSGYLKSVEFTLLAGL